jgi:hypothetical protein
MQKGSSEDREFFERKNGSPGGSIIYGNWTSLFTSFRWPSRRAVSRRGDEDGAAMAAPKLTRAPPQQLPSDDFFIDKHALSSSIIAM